MNKRVNWIDWAKVIGIYFVVLGHTQFNASNMMYKDLIYSFHMPLFFILSGYLFNIGSDFSNFVKKNVISLIIPYILLNLIVFAIFYLSRYYLNELSFSQLKTPIYSFLIGHGHAPAGPTWFLICLFFVRIYSFFILKLKTVYQTVILFASPIIAYIIAYQLKIDIYFAIDSSLVALPFFMIGYYLKKYNTLDCVNSSYKQLVFVIISFIVLLFLCSIQGRVDIHACNFGNYPILYYPQTLIGSFMIIMFSMLFNKIENKFIKNISSGTLIILAFHPHMPYWIYRITNHFYPIQINLTNNIIISVLIILILYYPILFVKKYFPVLIGNRK